MLTKTDENCGGRPCNCAAPCDKNCTSLNKNVSNPPQCQRCTGEYEVFHMPGHPDDGVEFACGIMVENREAGVMVFSCPYFKDSIAPVYDAEAEQRKAHNAATRGRFARKRPVVTEEPVPSPHDFLDAALPVRDVRMAEKIAYYHALREGQ